MKADTFSTRRFTALLRWLFTAHQADLLRRFSILAVFFLVFEGMMCSVMLRDGDDPDTLRVIIRMCVVCAVFIMASFFNQAFAMRKGKEERVGLLMLPASNAEKFWAILLFYALAGMATTLGAFIVADTLRWGIDALTLCFGSPYWGVPVFFHCGPVVQIASDGHVAAAASSACLALSAALWGASLFVLTGIALRRMSAGAAMLSGVAVMTAYAWIVIWMDGYCPSLLHLTDGHLTLAALAQALVVLALAFVNIGLSYRLFCRLTISHGRWLNI